MITVSDGASTLDIGAGWDSMEDSEQRIALARTIGGKESSYLWNTVEKLTIPVQTMSSSDAWLLTDWYTKNTQLIVVFDQSTYDCYLSAPPIGNFNPPYQTEYNGTLAFEVV